MREIVVDTETTGLDPGAGHRIVEVACLELVNHVPTGNLFHRHVNPERDMPEEAYAVHGISAEFLRRQPLFGDIAEEFLDFIEAAPLVIHNAEFDLAFLNAELGRFGHPLLPPERARDTLEIARRKFPGAPVSLDALCRRFAIDNSARDRHGALLDARLLAEVYLELLGGRQPGLGLTASAPAVPTTRAGERPVREARPHAPSGDELAAHEALVARLKNPIWNS